MRGINLSNVRQRNAVVGFEAKKQKSQIKTASVDGREYENTRFLKSTVDTTPNALISRYGNLDDLANAILESDPEIDLQKEGMKIKRVKRIVVDENENLVFNINKDENIYNTDGSLKMVHTYIETESNINIDVPIRWTKKFVDKTKAIHMFAFTRKYQIKHVNGLTYDFLYDMAKYLDENHCMMMVAGGKSGKDSIVFQRGGIPFKGFLEGRVNGDKYMLILHLTNMEIKSAEVEEIEVNKQIA